MENTGKVLFEDDSAPQWYIALGDQWVGPLTASDVYEKVLGQEITWAHFVWKPGQPGWKRICDLETFQAAVPALPGTQVQNRVKEAARVSEVASQPVSPSIAAAASRAGNEPAYLHIPKTGHAERVWFLYYNDTQFGPFSHEEVWRFLRIGKIHGRVYTWRDGMPTWERLENIVLFDEAVAESKRVREGAKPPEPPVKGAKTINPPPLDQSVEQSPPEQRAAPRRPLVARILLTHETEAAVNVAICRDISVGGMQVLTDRIPGLIGTRIKMNVSPSGDASSSKIQPFVAEGVIVRILEDRRGFSFRFEKLRDEAKRAIEEYIVSLV